MTRGDFPELARQAGTDRGRIEESATLEGLALHGERRLVTRAGAIAFLQWQALRFDGTWNTEELEECAYCFKPVDLI
ncbi:MAG: hypothetical protein A4E61_01599 [Syntrophorhabdus sp. PtaB.Bin184]|nr:MAG: hypothetical protein A4E61_01599 [Syntrophorhabdus sp. PtaB.Bin184]